MPKTRVFNRITALYERLSKDDEQQGESNSILNQKQYLEEFARKNGLAKIQHFTDDGYTGRNFNRPGFQAMLAEIEAGNVGTVIVKDMSRFGRNYLQVGFYTEILFPKKDVRFIAINNSVDSEKPQDNDFTPFLNIMNEWYAKDTSNKIKSIFLSRMNDGKRCSGSIPYGFYRLPEDKQTLLIDPPAAKVVKHIFELAVEGNNPAEIARQLTEENILIPSAYTLQYHPEQCNRKAEPGATRWSATTVREILNRQEYIGHTVLRKTIATNFKTDSRRPATDEERLVFENTHEPIVSEELFEQARRSLKHAVRRLKEGTHQTDCRLPGLVFCADCGERLHYDVHYYRNGGTYFTYRCGNYASRTRSCTAHYISEKSLCELVLHSIQRISNRVIADERGFAEELRQRWQAQAQARPLEQKEELFKIKRRLDELDRLIGGLYENYVSDLLPEKQYKTLMKKYSAEQTTLENRKEEIEADVQKEKTTFADIGRFIKLIKQYKEPQELTVEMACSLIDKICVHEAVGRKPNRTQQVDIYYNFIGQFDLPLTEAEIAEEAKKEKKKAKKKAKVDKEKQRKRNKAYREKVKAERYAANDGHKFSKRVCEQCGNEFWPNSTAQKYCSTECARVHQDEERKRKRFEEKGNHLFKQKKCIVCGKPFWPTNGQELMCSDECKLQHRRECQREYYRSKVSDTERKKRLEAKEKLKEQNGGHLLPQRECEYCGELYWPVRESQKYCCKKCCNAAVESQRLGRDVAEKEGHKFFKKVCAECGKEFWPNGPSEVCCSDECKASRMSRQHKERYAEISAIKNAEKDGHKFPQQICEFCGKEYWPTTPNQRYCSPDCLRNGRISARHDGRNPAEKDGHPYFERTCIVCGKKFWPNGPSTKTCSEECRRERARQQGCEFRERQKQTEAEKTA